MLKNINGRQLSIILTLVFMIIINILANAIPLNGVTTAEISDSFDIFFVPAGYVFSIWGLIYIGLTMFTIYQALPSQLENPRLIQAALPILIGNLANIRWVFAWHYHQFGLAMLMMVTLLGTLIWVYTSLGVNKEEVSPTEYWMVQVPFSIYLGWISVATIANTSTWLEYIHWDGWGIDPQIWAVIMLVTASLIATAITISRKDTAFLAVLVWAFAGIAIKFPDTPLVNISAWTATAYIVVLILLIFLSKLRGQTAALINRTSTI